MDSRLSPVSLNRTCSVAQALLWNLFGHDRTLLLGAFGRPTIAFGYAENIAVMMNSVTCESDHRVCHCGCTDNDRTRPVPSWQRPVVSAEPLLHSFLRDLTSGLVPIFVLGLCLVSWVFYCASRVLLEVLIIRSSHCLHPSHMCNLLDYNINTQKHISLIWSC